MLLYYLKAFHIIGFVAWFAGLFYLVRMFVYRVEADDRPEPLRAAFQDQFNKMAWRVYKIIANPAMMITWACGIAMTIINPDYWTMEWFQIKFSLLVLLVGYHLWCKYTIIKLEQGKKPFSSFQFRLLNELPTLFLVSIVLLGILKDTLQVAYAFGGVLAFGMVLFVFAKIYRAARAKNENL